MRREEQTNRKLWAVISYLSLIISVQLLLSICMPHMLFSSAKLTCQTKIKWSTFIYRRHRMGRLYHHVLIEHWALAPVASPPLPPCVLHQIHRNHLPLRFIFKNIRCMLWFGCQKKKTNVTNFMHSCELGNFVICLLNWFDRLKSPTIIS